MKKSVSMKTLVLLLAVMLLIGGTIGGTLAYLSTKSNEVKNTFTPSDISITLTESNPTNQTAKMVPGATIAKDPKVKVNSGSEPCYLFVKIDAKNGVVPADTTDTSSAYVTYEVATGWTKLETTETTDGTVVYYREVTNNETDTTNALTENKSFDILKNNEVQVLSSVTKDMMTTIKNDTTKQPTLTFTAYAVQLAHVDSAADAWSQAKDLS